MVATETEIIQIALSIAAGILIVFLGIAFLLKKKLHESIKSENMKMSKVHDNSITKSFTEINENTVKNELERDKREPKRKYNKSIENIDNLERIKSFVKSNESLHRGATLTDEQF